MKQPAMATNNDTTSGRTVGTARIRPYVDSRHGDIRPVATIVSTPTLPYDSEFAPRPSRPSQ